MEVANQLLPNDPELSKILANHIEKMLYNIVALSTTISEVHEHKQVLKDDVMIVQKYIDHKCRIRPNQAGGGSMALPSEYFGNDSGRYVATPGQDRNTLLLDQGLIRAELSMTGGGISLAPLMKHVRKLAREKRVKIHKDALASMEALISRHLECLIKDLPKKLTKVRLQKLLEKKRHAIFL